MNRAELEAMGLTKEQVDNIIKINGNDIENAKSTSKAEITNLQSENESDLHERLWHYWCHEFIIKMENFKLKHFRLRTRQRMKPMQQKSLR